MVIVLHGVSPASGPWRQATMCDIYAVDQGCGRIDWHVQASNHAGLGAERVDGRLNYRLHRPAMDALAQADIGVP